MKGIECLNKLALKTVHRLINVGLIEKDDEVIYLYQVEVLFLKIIGILLIAIVGVFAEKYIETIVFYITFSSLRAYTNGYHSKNYIICLAESAITYILICQVVSVIFMKNLLLLHSLTFIAMIVIYALSPVNSDEIMLSKKEIAEHKQTLKYILIIYLLIVMMVVNFKVTSEIVVFFEIAILFDMVLVVIGKILYKEWR